MIFANCTCGKLFESDYDCGDKMGYDRFDCECGKVVMIERISIGGTTVIFGTEEKEEFEQFIKDKGLILND